MLNSMKDTIGYDDAWVSLHSQSPDLCEFSSGLATIYWTMGVESDFDTWLGEERVSFRIDGLFAGRYHACETIQGFAVHRVVRCSFAFRDASGTHLDNDLNRSI
jgi:hypothetical protein